MHKIDSLTYYFYFLIFNLNSEMLMKGPKMQERRNITCVLILVHCNLKGRATEMKDLEIGFRRPFNYEMCEGTKIKSFN